MKKNKTAAHILDFQSFPSGIFSFSDIWNLILFSTLNPLVNITNFTFIESFKGKCFIAFVFWKLSHIIDIFPENPIFQSQHDKTVYCWQYKQGATMKAACLSKI